MIRAGIRLLALLLLVPMLLGFLESVFFFSLMTHFRLQLTLAALLVAVLGLWRKDAWTLAGCAVTVLLGSITLLPYYFSNGHPVQPNSFRLYTANILGVNQNYDAIMSSIREADTEVVALLEVQKHHMEALEELKAEYPVSMFEPHRGDFFGMAMSRLPVTDQKVFGSKEIPNMRMKVQVGTSEVDIFLIHPFPPVSRFADRAGFATLKLVARELENPERSVVAGDLNAAGWGARTRFLRDLGLVEARLGFGYQATWPVNMPLMYIPIDHVMVGRELSVHSFTTLKPVGSDHLPLLTEIGVPQ